MECDSSDIKVRSDGEAGLLSLEDQLTIGVEKLYEEAQITPKDIFKFMNNELRSVCNENKIKISVLPVQLCTLLLAFRKTRRMTNSQVKQELNNYLKEKGII